MSTNINEIGVNPCLCEVCGRPALAANCSGDGYTCRFCGKMYCAEHQHNLALTHLTGGECSYVCKDCIDKYKLRVIDPNHPYYMKYKGN
jgi:hypothetical protein